MDGGVWKRCREQSASFAYASTAADPMDAFTARLARDWAASLWERHAPTQPDSSLLPNNLRLYECEQKLLSAALIRALSN